MSQEIFTRYTIKLNEYHKSYSSLLNDIEVYLQDCLQIEESSEVFSENYNASSCFFHGELFISFQSFGSQSPITLSNAVLEQIKENINSQPLSCYYFYEELDVTGCWHVFDAFGKALPIFEKYVEYSRVASDDTVKKFRDELYA